MLVRPDRPKRDSRPKKPKATSPVSLAVRRWLNGLLVQRPGNGVVLSPLAIDDMVFKAPKRWSVYEPMALLPTGSFSGAPWTDLLAAATVDQRDELWRDILAAVSPGGRPLTHLAVNESIPLHVEGPRPQGPQGPQGPENILRSPTGLQPLYGDFGPAGDGSRPSADDYALALWVTTQQNGILQTWAPRWSMFSRGNVTEKARLLAWESGASAASNTKTKPEQTDNWAVDLYAGIGYFVFSYARRGLRVLCWELNPWSAEALRRGGALNRWQVRVVETTETETDDDFCRQTCEAVADGAQIIVFVEDNCHATRRLAVLRAAGVCLPVEHVNCGMLPTSRDSWQTAWDAVVGERVPGGGGGQPAWLHLHENVGARDVHARRQTIQALMDVWGAAETSASRQTTALVENVELVKSFAPGVWHCVYDVRITRP